MLVHRATDKLLESWSLQNNTWRIHGRSLSIFITLAIYATKADSALLITGG